MPSIRNLSHSQSGYYLVRGILLIFLLIFILVGLTFWGEANNFDLSYEYYGDELFFLSVGIFLKQIDNSSPAVSLEAICNCK